MPKKRKTRDFGAEYRRRIALAESRGQSRSVGRGHARAGERPKVPGLRLINPKLPEEQAIRRIAKGATLRSAALSEGLPEGKLRRYLKENTAATWNGRAWTILDSRPRQFPFYSQGRLIAPRLSLEEASKAAKFEQAVRAFLPTGDEERLAPFVGESVTDIRGLRYRFETRPNTLYELDSAGELDFLELYKTVVEG